MDPYHALTDSTPQTKLELFIQCHNLKNKDLVSKSDPICVVKLGESISTTTTASAGSTSGLNRQYHFVELGRTEIQPNNLNPSFLKTFMVNYKFEEIQPIQFLIYDVDNATQNLSDDDFLGQAELKVSDIVSKNNSTINVPLLDKHGKCQHGGSITIKAEERSKIRDFVVNLQLECKDLANKDFLGKSDPFFIISKYGNNRQLIDLVKSEVVMDNLNPLFQPMTISMMKLCQMDENVELKLSVFDWDKNSDPDLIGSTHFTVKQLKELHNSAQHLTLNDPKKKKSTGKVYVRSLSIQQAEEEYTFVDYLSGGLEVSLITAIDFTGSNGKPTDPNSLHYFGTQMNEYEMALRSIGDILSVYDHDKCFPSYGFGAKLPGGQISHCFALNGNPSQPHCVGVDGILQAYRLALNTVELWGPTNFASIIQTATSQSSQLSQEQSQCNQKYLILLLLTDGEITDMNETINELVKASRYPLSVIIVGVGSDDFKSMIQLDSDDRTLKSPINGQVAVRDIVQFVPFRKFGNHLEMLARETLREVPAQVVQYFKSMKIKPNKRV